MTQANVFALDIDTVYENLVDLISETRLEHVEHLDYMEPSSEVKDGNLFVSIPLYVDMTDSKGTFIENMPFIARGEINENGTILNFGIFDIMPIPSSWVPEAFNVKAFMPRQKCLDK